jgi:hypothetical protein
MKDDPVFCVSHYTVSVYLKMSVLKDIHFSNSSPNNNCNLVSSRNEVGLGADGDADVSSPECRAKP